MRSEIEIHADPVTRTVYSTDNSIYQMRPTGVALPSASDQIQALLASNAAAPNPKPIVARGGGTGTNGQSLTNGVIIDVKRNLNRIISIDPESRTAVVEPGVVTAELNAALAAHGLFWAPHTSTLNRATVGGMISTDAAGKGSLVHGRAHHHVVSLEVLLVDGTPWTAEPVTVAEAQRRAAQRGPGGELWQALLDLPLVEGANYGLPELARGFSGYGIDRCRRDGLIDPVALITGAEGTLAVITQATIKLTKLPTHTLLMAASYDSFADALDDAVELAATQPSAIESFDETTLERGRSSPAWPALGAVVGEHRGAVLLLEYAGDVSDPSTLRSEEVIEAALKATGRSRAARALPDPKDQAAAWKVRADAVGLLAKVATGGPERSARPVAFVEDCAVPVAAMGDFIRGFRDVLDSAGVVYGMFGHADVGCVHVRPALDLTDPEHVDLVRSITDDVVALVAKHGGVLWGEHGRGFRGDSVSKFLSPETIAIMRQVKQAFDPNDLLNPGKLYRPSSSNQDIVAVDAAELRGQTDRTVPVEIRREFGHAFSCNGNGLCHHYGGAEVMCPSYKATGDPALSPKGRADLIRAWLADRQGGAEPGLADPQFEDAIAANLGECLSCSACSGHCPVEVDIPELKSQFLDKYYEKRRRPMSHAMLSRFEQLAGLAGRLPRLAGLGTGPAGRLLGLVDLPAPAAGPKPDAVVFEPNDEPYDIVIMPDVFTQALDVATLSRSVEVLKSLGYSVAISRFVGSGKFDHVKGRRQAFAQAVGAQASMVRAISATGAIPVVIEPAVALLHRAEYEHALDGYPGDQVRHIVELIDDRRDRLVASASPTAAKLMAHCTERATAPGVVSAWQRVLEAAGHSVEVPAVGCCGMAGIFGHEVENQKMSRTLWDLTWADQMAPGDSAITVVATGYSCRSQAKRFARDPIKHPIHLL